MAKDFEAGDHVSWNSEAGLVRGTIKKKHTSEITFKGYTVRASKEEPQYLIKSDKTDHLAMHKGSAVARVDSRQALSLAAAGWRDRRRHSSARTAVRLYLLVP